MTESMTVDCRGMQCPAPILHLAKTARQAAGKPLLLEVMADDSDFPMDLEAWCRTTRSALHRMTCEGGVHRALIGLNGAQAASVPSPAPEPVARITTPGEPRVASISSARPRPASAPPARAQVGAPPPPRPPSNPPREARAGAASRVVDLRGLRAPAPILQLSQLAAQHPGASVTIHADDPTFLTDAMGFATALRATVVSARQSEGGSVIELVLPGGVAAARSPMAPPPAIELEAPPPPAALSLVGAGASTALATVAASERDNRCAILVLHNDFESLMAALMVANASAAQGMDVVVFFSFWGVNLLRGERPRKDVPSAGISFLQRVMKWMMPKGPDRQKMSKMHMGGMGKGMMVHFMRRNNVMALSELIDSAVDQKVRFIVCSMSMGIMGIEKRDIMDLPNLEFAGVTCFVEEARHSGVSLVF